MQQSSDISEDSDSEHCSDSDSDNSDSDQCLLGQVTENNLRIHKKSKYKPDIVDLSCTGGKKDGECCHTLDSDKGW